MPADIKVPVKQTKFYDQAHGAAITEQQIPTWNAKGGTVMLDEFNKEKKAIPKNRHRIPRVEDQNVIVGSGAPNKKQQSPEGGPFEWDMDGRRHKK